MATVLNDGDTIQSHLDTEDALFAAIEKFIKNNCGMDNEVNEALTQLLMELLTSHTELLEAIVSQEVALNQLKELQKECVGKDELRLFKEDFEQRIGRAVPAMARQVTQRIEETVAAALGNRLGDNELAKRIISKLEVHIAEVQTSLQENLRSGFTF